MTALTPETHRSFPIRNAQSPSTRPAIDEPCRAGRITHGSGHRTRVRRFWRGLVLRLHDGLHEDTLANQNVGTHHPSQAPTTPSHTNHLHPPSQPPTPP